MKGKSKKIKTLKCARHISRFNSVEIRLKTGNLASLLMTDGVSGGDVLNRQKPLLLRNKHIYVLLQEQAKIKSRKIVAETRECNPIAIITGSTEYKGDTSAQVTGEKVLKGS